MIRFVCRFVGLLSLTAAAAALGYDGATSVFARSMYVSSVGSVWENIPRSWLAALQPAVERLALVWCDVLQPYFLKQPVWLVLGIVGATLLWAKEEATDRTRERLRQSLR
jgi:hypothetical protein